MKQINEVALVTGVVKRGDVLNIRVHWGAFRDWVHWDANIWRLGYTGMRRRHCNKLNSTLLKKILVTNFCFICFPILPNTIVISFYFSWIGPN